MATNYDFNTNLCDLKGTETTQKLAEPLAELVGTETKGNARKLADWVKALNVDGILTLDRADKDLLVSILENSDRMFIFVKGQILDVLDSK